jgi:carbon-monoxide dehydrogenase large subunit
MGSGQIFPFGHGPAAVLAMALPDGYDVPNFSVRYRCVVTNTCPTGALRGYGKSTRSFAVERAFDMLARRLGMDPARFRLANLIDEASLPSRTITGAKIDSGSHRRSLELALADAHYDAVRARQLLQDRDSPVRLGIGVVAVAESAAPPHETFSGVPDETESVRLCIREDGLVDVFTGVPSQGQGHRTALAQIAASELGLRPDQIAVFQGDTDFGLPSQGAFGSRTAVVVGNAVRLAALSLRARLGAAAAEALGSRALDVDVAPDMSADGIWEQLQAAAKHLKATRGPDALCVQTYFRPPNIDAAPDSRGRASRHGSWANAAHVCTVVVDVRTGSCRILRYVVAHDCGRLINPLIVEGQLRGGVALGIGAALSERVEYSSDGHPTVRSYRAAGLATCLEVPPIEIRHVQTVATSNPGGYKGMGEGGTIGATAAIVNAVADALASVGVVVTHADVSPRSIRQMLGDAPP